jgi:hypothetical protein
MFRHLAVILVLRSAISCLASLQSRPISDGRTVIQSQERNVIQDVDEEDVIRSQNNDGFESQADDEVIQYLQSDITKTQKNEDDRKHLDIKDDIIQPRDGIHRQGVIHYSADADDVPQFRDVTADDVIEDEPERNLWVPPVSCNYFFSTNYYVIFSFP